MRETGLSALGRYAARGKQYLVLLSPMGEGVVMEQLRYSHEVRSFSEVPLGDAEITEGAGPGGAADPESHGGVHPDNYKDDVRSGCWS